MGSFVRKSRLTETGLAISGGADSMALAYLCRQMQIEKLIDGLSVTAFVVDHKAREESSREARMVAGWLSDMGAQLLTIPFLYFMIPTVLYLTF